MGGGVCRSIFERQRFERRREGLADPLDDAGDEFAPVGATKEELIALQANRNAISGLPFAGSVAARGGAIVFAGVHDPVDIDDNGRTRALVANFAQNFSFGALPIFPIVTGYFAALQVEVGGALTNYALQTRRRSTEFVRHRKTCSIPLLDL